MSVMTSPQRKAVDARIFAEVVRTLPLAAAVFDRDMRYLAHNDAWLAVRGPTPLRDLAGQLHYEVFPDAGLELRRVHGRCLAGAEERGNLDRFVNADGNEVCVRWAVVPWYESPGHIGGVIVYAEDVTEEERTRRQLAERESLIRDLFDRSPIGLNGFLVERERQTYIGPLIEDLTSPRALEADLENERLKAIQSSKLATIGEMAAGIAHELNTPLGIIEAYAFALEDARRRGDDAKADEALKAIRDAVGRAAKIVRGLRKFTRQSKDDPPEDVDVGRLVDEAVSLCNARLRDHAVTVTVEIARALAVRGHSVELGQVLVNLLNNAVDAVRSLDHRWIRVVVDDGDGVSSPAGTSGGEGALPVTISVEDSGPGIPPELVGDIFRAFFTTKGVGEGTGLGLSISRSIVERHGGTLTYDATAPHTKFVLTLPRVGP